MFSCSSWIQRCMCDNIEIVQWKPGTFMREHKDTQDICSAIVYLNDDFQGGERKEYVSMILEVKN